jgi:hypothetical protein
VLSERLDHHDILWLRWANQLFILEPSSGTHCFDARTERPPIQRTRPDAPPSSSSPIRHAELIQESLPQGLKSLYIEALSNCPSIVIIKSFKDLWTLARESCLYTGSLSWKSSVYGSNGESTAYFEGSQSITIA